MPTIKITELSLTKTAADTDLIVIETNNGTKTIKKVDLIDEVIKAKITAALSKEY